MSLYMADPHPRPWWKRVLDRLTRRKVPQYRGWQDVGWIDETWEAPEGLVVRGTLHPGATALHERLRGVSAGSWEVQ